MKVQIKRLQKCMTMMSLFAGPLLVNAQQMGQSLNAAHALSKSGTGNRTFTLTGTIANPVPGARVYIMDLNTRKIDSAIIENGTFNYTDTASEFPFSRFVFLTHNIHAGLRNHGRDLRHVFFEPGITHVDIKDSIKYATLTGKTNQELEAYVKSIHVEDPGNKYGVNGEFVLMFRSFRLPGDNRPPDTSAVAKKAAAYAAERDQLINKRRELQKQFIETHPDSYISLIALEAYAGLPDNMDTTTVASLFKSLNPALQHLGEGQRLLVLLNKARTGNFQTPGEQMAKKIKDRTEMAKPAFDIGMTAPNFTLKDKEDKPVSLNDFKGKYVLIDFWASWCGPCRAENPNVVNAYNEFKDRNFTVMGISIDKPTAKSKWLEAIQKDGLPYTQVMDSPSTPVAIIFHVVTIPRNYLIDPNGKIVAYDLRGPALQKKLAELLN